MPSATRAPAYGGDRAPAVPVHAEPLAVVWKRTSAPVPVRMGWGGDRVVPARPTGLPLWRNVAFPAWALVALGAACMLSLTHAGATLGDQPRTASALRITAAIAAVGVAIAAAGRGALSLSRRL